MGGRPWFARTTEAIYAYRTRKPGAVWGWPVIGRHWGYVGRTNHLERRNQQHLYGGGTYGAVAKPWADLEPKLYVLVRPGRRLELTTHLLEWAWIKILMPVYNVSMNRSNPRRIKPWDQHAQRRARDTGHLVGAVTGARRRFPMYALTLLLGVSWTSVLLTR
jgi:hypothetical protein